MNCGRVIKPFFSYCMFCGTSTEDNPKCNIIKKESKQLPKTARIILNSIENYSASISDDEILRKVDDLTSKIRSIIPLFEERVEQNKINSEERSLVNTYLPKIDELVGKYIELQDEKDDSLEELKKQLTQGLDSFCDSLDSIKQQIVEEKVTDVSVDLEVLDILLKK